MKSSTALLVLLGVAFTAVAAGTLTQANRDETRELARLASVRSVAAPPVAAAENGDLKGSADNAAIAQATSLILMRRHYAQKPLNDEVSAATLDRYLDMLDPQRLYFLQSDVAEFEPWRTSLDDLVQKGDTTPARTIFTRFLERFDAQTAYVGELLKTEKFAFEGNDTYLLDRKEAPRPATLEEAKQVWRDRLRYEYLQEKLNKEKPDEILKILTRRYSRVSRTLHEYDGDDIFELFLTSLAHVYDPHSDYMGKAMYENFGISMKLSLFGVGALLQSEDGYVKIVELTPGGPAIKSNKLKPGDRIVGVAQGNADFVEVMDMKLQKVVEMIRGPKNSVVRLRVIPVDAPDPSHRKVVTLVRDQVRLEEQEAKARIVEVPQPGGKYQRLGVIDLPSFYEDMDDRGVNRKSTTADVSKLVRKLKAEKVAGIVLDLRRNGGGSLDEAIRLTGLFIKAGPIVQVRDPDGRVEVDRDPDPTVLYDGPLVVLTSRFSASASEILAGALQDYGRAAIVGDSSTHGKGTVQAVIELAPLFQQSGMNLTINPGALKLTIRKFYRASGSSTQLKGVVPDIVLPSVNNHAEVGEKAMDNPMPWDTIPATNYAKVNRIPPVLPELRRRSAARVAKNKDFAFVNQQIAQFKKTLAQKQVSLNEQERLTERKEAEARVEARRKELRARPPSKERVYTLSVRQALLPGLPPLQKPEAVAKETADETPTSAEDSESGTPDEKLPAVDVTMDEAKRILSDLIALSAKKEPAIAAKKR